MRHSPNSTISRWIIAAGLLLLVVGACAAKWEHKKRTLRKEVLVACSGDSRCEEFTLRRFDSCFRKNSRWKGNRLYADRSAIARCVGDE